MLPELDKAKKDSPWSLGKHFPPALPAPQLLTSGS